MVTVNFSNGKQDEEFSSIQSAVKSVLRDYPNGVVYDAGGFKRGKGAKDASYDVRNGRAALIWRTAAESRNDDGARAVASINVS